MPHRCVSPAVPSIQDFVTEARQYTATPLRAQEGELNAREAPMMEQSHFKHLHENDTYIRPQDFPMVDDLLD